MRYLNLIEDRAEKLNELTRGLPVTKRFPLIHEVDIDHTLFRDAQHAAGQYLNATIREAVGSSGYVDYEHMVRLWGADLFSLPNVTPNGIIKPKLDTAAEFHLLHKMIVNIMSPVVFGRKSRIKKMRVPLVLRMVNGKAGEEVTGRPRANNVLHSDFWTGSCCDLALLLPLLGDVERTGVLFGEPVDPAPDFLQELPSYKDGARLYKEFKPYDLKLRKGFLYFQDIFCLHATDRQGGGVRVSMDWTVQTENYPEIERRHSSRALKTDNHFELDSWLRFGRELMFLDTETIGECAVIRRPKKEDVKLGAAVAGQTSHTSKIVNLISAANARSLARRR